MLQKLKDDKNLLFQIFRRSNLMKHLQINSSKKKKSISTESMLFKVNLNILKVIFN